MRKNEIKMLDFISIVCYNLNMFCIKTDIKPVITQYEVLKYNTKSMKDEKIKESEMNC